jgi:hypothetical protein
MGWSKTIRNNRFKLMHIIKDNFLNKEEKKYLDEIVLGDKFNWFWAANQVTNDKKPFFYHMLLNRPEESEKRISEPSSTHFPFFRNLLVKFCHAHHIPLSNIYRAAINLTFPIGVKKIKKHVDHDFPHNQVIIYLNDADGNTDIYDKNGKLEVSVSPKKYRILFFTSRLHGVNLPIKSKRRVIAVFTFI